MNLKCIEPRQSYEGISVDFEWRNASCQVAFFFYIFFIYLRNISWKCGFTFTFDFMITWIMAALWLRFSYFPGLQAHDVNLSMYQSYDRISYGVAVLLLMLR